MMRPSDEALARTLRNQVESLQDTAGALDPLLKRLGRASYVLIGEASHGTHDFYRIRAEITKRLIREHGFTVVAVEGDWPDAYRVNRYVRGLSADRGALEALGSFERFPSWMWRNADVLDFVGWLRTHNDSLDQGASKVGFYGIDVYSLHSSIEAVLAYLDDRYPEEARAARERYACFEVFGDDPKTYGYATTLGRLPTCEDEVIAQLLSLREQRATLLERDGLAEDDEFLFAEQNARVVKNAEQYYRIMYRGGSASWNHRDQHMAETVEALARHFALRHGRARIVIWAHNSHLGDARATQVAERGQLNLGQLMRQRYGDEVALVGFSTNTGSVTAASDWGAVAQRMRVRNGLPGSYEELFHHVGISKFLLLPLETTAADELNRPRLQRAIGVIYRPETERQSHYYHTRLTDQFDAMIYLDQTRAVEPLDRTTYWERGELPDTYPSGM